MPSWCRPLLLISSFAMVACATEEGPGAEAGTETGVGDGDGDPGDGDGEPGDGDGDPGDGDGEPGELVQVSGDAFAFGPAIMVANATVTILELPDQQTSTDADGHFVFEALPAGAAATFVFDKPGYPRIYIKTFTLPDEGELERVTFQAPDSATFGVFAQLAEVVPDPRACQIASTVTRVGKSLYDGEAHGEEGATVSISPSLPAEHGPIYFNANVIPQKDLTETSEDGGVLFSNVPPGTYVLSAHKDGVSFEDVTVQCDPDVLVNPSPPYGLQALAD
ncbi:MAG: carboxypeptidase regulatory-like domain-containing protein [Enhygromyxa sp.]